MEIYKTPAGPASHKETPHYLAWRQAVGDMMAAPRTAQKYTPVYPWPGMWGTSAASRRDQGQGLTLVHFSAQRDRFLWDRVAFRGF